MPLVVANMVRLSKSRAPLLFPFLICSLLPAFRALLISLSFLYLKDFSLTSSFLFRRIHDLKPDMTLNHLVKERYPRFIDALRDLDDTLCMIHLFAALPSTGRIVSEVTLSCKKLAREWQYYIAKTRSLKKVFVSVKGVYYQAEVMGETITWIVPHPFTQTLPKEVDFRVMLTFLEFYEVFFRFVLFKLYNTKNMNYPPIIDAKLDKEGAYLLAMKTEALESAEQAQITNEEDNEAQETESVEVDPSLQEKISTLDKVLDKFQEDDDDEEDLPYGLITKSLDLAFSDLQKVNKNDEDNSEEQLTFYKNSDETSAESKFQNLFSSYTFFINREVPLDWLQFIITSFGGTVGWDSPLSPIKVDDSRITHQIIDRPIQAQIPGREYVQPQWVFDSVNAKVTLPTRLYAPGAALPPHLSPFVDDEKEGYVPRFKEEVRKLQKQAGVVEDDNKETAQDDAEDSEDDDEAEDYIKRVRDERLGKNKSKKQESEDESEESEEEVEELDEVPEAPAAPAKKGQKAVVYKAKEAFQDEATEATAIAKSMMSSKTKRLYDRMQHGIAKKSDSVKNLEKKRKALEEPSEDKNNKKKAKK